MIRLTRQTERFKRNKDIPLHLSLPEGTGGGLTITAADTLTPFMDNGTSANVPMVPGTWRLQILVPNETSLPGSSSGRRVLLHHRRQACSSRDYPCL